MSSQGQRMTIPPVKRSLRLRASIEAFDILRASGSPKTPNAEILKHAVTNDLEPHPRVVREVYQALLEARAAQPKEQPSPLKAISGIFSRKAAPARASDDVVRRFERAFDQPS